MKALGLLSVTIAMGLAGAPASAQVAAAKVEIVPQTSGRGCQRPLAFSPDGERLLVSTTPCSDAFTVERYVLSEWHVATQTLLRSIPMTRPGRSARFAADGRRTLVASAVPGNDDAQVAIWDLALNQPIVELSRDAFAGTAMSRDGRYAAVATSHHRANDDGVDLALWDLDRGSEVWRKPNTRAGLLTFADDGRTLVYAEGRAIVSLDLGARRESTALEHRSEVSILIALPAAGRFASADRDGEIRVWEAGRTLATFDEGGPIERLAASPDGARIAAMDAFYSPKPRPPAKLRLWDVGGGKSAGELPVDNFEMDGKRGKSHVKTFIDAAVTRENIATAKQLLAAARVDDTVVLFVAGHGVHARDAEARFYYATYETDVDRLADSAAPFEMIEDLLSGIAPRRKLFMLDTCESGEREPDAAAPEAAAGGRGLRARRTRALVVKADVPARPFLFDRERYIENDLFAEPERSCCRRRAAAR